MPPVFETRVIREPRVIPGTRNNSALATPNVRLSSGITRPKLSQHYRRDKHGTRKNGCSLRRWRFCGNWLSRTWTCSPGKPSLAGSLFKVRRPSCRPINAAKIGQKHCDGSVGCLVLQLKRSCTPVTITAFLTWEQHAATMLSWWGGNTVVAMLFTGHTVS